MLRPPKIDCYDYIRRYYNVPAYIGVRVRVDGKEGVIVESKSQPHYIRIRLDGQREANPYHPTYGITYLVQGKEQS